MKKTKLTCILFLLITIGAIGHVHAQQTREVVQLDSCNQHDQCENAIVINNVVSDLMFQCITSCNTGSTPEAQNNSCAIGVTPTVWFKVFTDDFAALMNIFVTSDDFDAPTISLFLQISDCTVITPVALTSSDLPCIEGSDGEAEALGSDVGANSFYYIAIGTATGQMGSFDLCVNTISNASVCVQDRSIEITSRSGSGPLEGPFDPNETISICMNVNSYSAAGNGCQWLQGIVPVFGNGWDPSSFDAMGQPLNATINGNSMGVAGNGLYGTSIWDWFSDVDHHYDDPFLQIGDIDGNGTVDMCHLLYSFECPNFGGINGGCCGPCWGAPLGDILPPGWFAYGINGSCGTPGPPVGVDWGDGNTCTGGMGPWQFCFDLQIRDYPACLEDESTRDLSLGFFTFADGSVGSWTGSASVCALDQPAKLTLPLKCGDVEIDLGIETLPALCAGDSLIYQIEYPAIDNWTWHISPVGYVQQPVYEGDNGYVINHVVDNQTMSPKTITYSFTGHYDSTDNIVIKRLRFDVYPQIVISLPPDMTICEKDSALMINPQITGGTGNYIFQWMPTGETTPTIVLYKPFLSDIGLVVSDEVGCLGSDSMHIKTKPCLKGDSIPIFDEDNEPDDPKDPPPPPGNFSDPHHVHDFRNDVSINDLFTITPVPAKDRIVISLSQLLSLNDRIVMFDVNGKVIMPIDNTVIEGFAETFSITQLPTGIYYITLFTNQASATRRFVKL